MTAEMAIPSSETTKPQKVLLGSITALAQSAWMGFALASDALGRGRQVLFNAQFGGSPQANAYYAPFRLPDTLFSLIAGGALSSAMIPVLLNARQKEGDAAGWLLISRVLTTLLGTFVLLILAVEVFAP